jgi:LacI family transcriptional regulator
MKARITLRDVALRSNVHVSTVSLALRNSPRLPEETRTRVQAIAKEMGYAHDPLLDALLAYRDSSRRQSHPAVLAYVTSWPVALDKSPHHRFYWHGAQRRATELGFRLEQFSLAEPGMTDVRLGNILLARGIHGVVLSSFSEGSAEVRFDWPQFCAVRIELQPVWPPLNTTAVDHVRAIQEAVRQVLRLGYRRPGFILGHNWSELVEDHWKMGFLWAQQALPRADRLPIFLFKSDWKDVPRQFRFKEWFAGNSPDVLIGPFKQIELRLGDIGLGVPGDIAVVDPFLETAHPFYSGILHDFEEVGARAIENLVMAVTQNRRGIPPIVDRSYVDGSWRGGPSCPPSRNVGRREWPSDNLNDMTMDPFRGLRSIGPSEPSPDHRPGKHRFQ